MCVCVCVCVLSQLSLSSVAVLSAIIFSSNSSIFSPVLPCVFSVYYFSRHTLVSLFDLCLYICCWYHWGLPLLCLHCFANRKALTSLQMFQLISSSTTTFCLCFSLLLTFSIFFVALTFKLCLVMQMVTFVSELNLCQHFCRRQRAGSLGNVLATCSLTATPASATTTYPSQTAAAASQPCWTHYPIMYNQCRLL